MLSPRFDTDFSLSPFHIAAVVGFLMMGLGCSPAPDEPTHIDDDESSQDEEQAPVCPDDADCSGLECGPDPICETYCGSCADGTCEDGQCVVDDQQCEPDCHGRDCGDDGCGGTCGSCEAHERCDGGTCTDCREVLDETLSTKTLEDGCTYVVEDDVHVPSGITVTADPGSRIEVTGLYTIIVNGTLDLRGDEDRPVVITTDRDSPQAGDWGNMFVGQNASLKARHAILEYFSGVRTNRADIDIIDSTIRQVRPANHIGSNVSSVSAAFDLGQYTDATFEHTTFEDMEGSAGRAIRAFDISSLTVTDCLFTDFETSAIFTSGFGPRDSAGVTVEHNEIRDGQGVGVVLSNIADSTVRYNDIRNNAELGINIGIDSTSTSSASYDVTDNNLVANSDIDVNAWGRAHVDASSVYWGDDVDPDERVEAEDNGGLAHASVDTSDAREEPIEDAGPR